MSGEGSALIELGVVGAPFGVRGWVKVRSYTDPPAALLDHATLELKVRGAWRAYRLEASQRGGTQLAAKLAGVDDRTAAEALRGACIAVERQRLPAPGAREYFRADLVGCEVQTLAGQRLGVLSHFVETPAHALMVIRGAREHWVPAVPRHLRRVDLAARRVVVDWDEAD